MESRAMREERWIRLGDLESGLGGPYVNAGAVVEEPSRILHRDALPHGRARDEAIVSAVAHLLAAHPAVLARGLSVTVTCGEVTLRGAVEDEPMRAAAGELVRSVAGVEGVVNLLRLERSALDASDRG